MGEHHLPRPEAGAGACRMSSMIPLSVAPMMDITDRHYRSFLRRITRHTLLYTEMITEQAIRHGDAARLLNFSAAEEPLALQLGGSDPDGLATATRIAHEAGYREVNLNVGCPSDRVQSGRFGACLMLEPAHVADLVTAMREASPMPVTVKHRIGVDDRDSFRQLLDFVDTVAAAGVTRFTVHARKAWLQGLSPRENREIPPLRYDYVRRLAAERPGLEFELNGGVRNLEQASAILTEGDVRAVMIGRGVTENPWILADADERFFGAAGPADSPAAAVRSYLEHIEQAMLEGVPYRVLVRPLLGMFTGMRGARAWRRHLSETATAAGSDASTVLAGLQLIDSGPVPVPAVHPGATAVPGR